MTQQSSNGGGHSGTAPSTKCAALNAFKSSSLHRNDVIVVDRAPSVEVWAPDELSSQNIDVLEGVLLTCVDPKALDEEPKKVDGVVVGLEDVNGPDVNGPDVCMLKLNNLERLLQ